MKERQILFSAPMVMAIISGTKTQTRRVAKLNPAGHVQLHHRYWHPADEAAALACPYGQPGDRMWVRETWGAIKNYDSFAPNKIPKGSSIGFKTDDISRWCQTGCGGAAGRWRPSIHMPRWASRITLEIVNVRVERVQEIGYEEIGKEGIPLEPGPLSHAAPIAVDRFENLWNSINAKRGFGWDKNPWVWVIEFKRIP